MNHIEKLTRLNVELEGLLHVLAKRDTSDLRKLLGEKYEEFNTLFKEFLANGETTDEAAEEALEKVDEILSSDEVKNQEAVSDEVESETEAAEDAISHEVHNEPLSLSSLDMPGEQMPLSEATEEKETVAQTSQVADDEDWSMMDSAEIVSVTVEDEPAAEQVAEPLESDSELKEIEEMPEAENDIRVDEMLTRRGAEDLRRVFTLNDKFRFRRELFHQNDDLFRDVLSRLDSFTSFELARDYIINDFETEGNKDTVEDFLNIIKPHYC